MLFQQTSAPTEWTKQTTHNNKTLRVVSGSASSGGTSSFTTVFASRSVTGSATVTGSNSGGSVSGYTLTTGEIPAHSHTYYQVGGGSGLASGPNFTGAALNNTGQNTGGGGSHSHGFTNPTWSQSSGTISGTMDFDVQYVDLIIAAKD